MRFVLLLLLLSPVHALQPTPQMLDMEGRIDEVRIRDCIDEVVQSYRVMGTPTQALFYETYKDVFANEGLVSVTQRFEEGGPGIGTNLPTGGNNIIGILEGTDPSRWVVIGGHYDTRELTAGGGALDNAAGMCTTLEFARVAKAHVDEFGPLAATLVFIWYDGEEWGLYGSQAFAADPSVVAAELGVVNATILVTQSFDMPGLNYPAKNVWLQYGNTTDVDEFAVLNLRTSPVNATNEWRCWSYGCYENLKQRPDFPAILANFTAYQDIVAFVAYDHLGLPPEYVWVYDDDYGRSDHIPLIAQGVPGMRIQGSHDEEYPCYHQPCDTLPALYALAGGEELFLAGLETQAKVGILTGAFVASNNGYHMSWASPVDSVSTPLRVTIAVLALAYVVSRRSQL